MIGIPSNLHILVAHALRPAPFHIEQGSVRHAPAATPKNYASPNLVTNGSFETDTQAAGTWNIYPNLTGWTGGASGIELRNNVAGTAYDGVNFIELDTYNNSSSSQIFGTVLGQLYSLSFAYAPRAGVAAGSNGIEVFWNSVSQGSFTGDGNVSSAWTLENLTVTGTGNDTLQFLAVGNSDGYGGSLDAVSLTNRVPEPATLVLLALGLAGLGFSSRKKA